MSLVFISICSAITLVVVLALCSCWKQPQQKDDWLGLDGMVKQKNPDENVNHIPLPSSVGNLQIVPPDCTARTTAFDSAQTNVSDDPAKRASVQTNTRRSLPDIPSEGQNLVAREGWDPVDNLSELYATVEPYGNVNGANGAKRHTLPSGSNPGPSISQHSSISQADDALDAFSPYASVNYDKLHQVEHPYAIVKSATAVQAEKAVEPLLGAEAPTATSRHSSQESVHVDINAASAVAGGITANQDLPYMTPPINPSHQQANFSGDSQDSSKGYTSISVREPLANIIAQTKGMRANAQKKRALDPHYATVSDDSDEMYTTIPDAMNPEYTSGSETYAQIQPLALSVAADICPPPQAPPPPLAPHEEAPPAEGIAPQPPSVDSLKHMTNTHSRQESELFTASSTSSILNLGSPKPEKRQANSPLPPPPVSTTSPPSADNVRNLDDMYAKVHKHRKRSIEDNSKRRSSSSISSYEEPNTDAATANIASITTHDYETLRKSPKKATNEPGYASIYGPESLDNDDPNYERLRTSRGSDDKGADYSVVSEPNYESVKHAESDSGCKRNVDECPTADDESSESSAAYERIECDAKDKPNDDYETIKNDLNDCFADDDDAIFEV